MKISNFFATFTGLLLLFALGGALLAIWTADRAEFYNQRINLAHRSYEQHLKLNANTYQLFKQFGDAMIIGDRDKGAGETHLISLIRQNIANIRAIIEEEIKLVGEEEVEELEALNKIERKIDGLVLRLLAVMKERARGGIKQNWQEISSILDHDIDQKFHARINAALAEEKEEVAEARADAKAQTVLATRLAYGFAVLAILLTLIAYSVYRRQVIGPFETLMRGVKSFSAGNFDQSIDVDAKNEITDVAVILNDMASKVRSRTLSLTEQNAKLEQAVQARTNELERLLSEAQKSEVNRRQLLADVSHELRTPLTIIQGESDIALRGDDKTPADYRDALARTRDAAAHTTQLVNDLLFISRKEAGEARLSLVETDLYQLIQETLEMSHVDAAFESTETSALVMADAVRLRQAILALLTNAQHYGGETIRVRLNMTPKGCRITVEDDGPGMTDDEKEKAFERFFRGSNASAHYNSGAGLGLPIVRSIAEAHAGIARLEDRSGGGTNAILEIPRRPRLRAVS